MLGPEFMVEQLRGRARSQRGCCREECELTGGLTLGREDDTPGNPAP